MLKVLLWRVKNEFNVLSHKNIWSHMKIYLNLHRLVKTGQNDMNNNTKVSP